MITPQQIEVDEKFRLDPAGWLLKQAKTYTLSYLLLHSDDGVAWGKVDGEELRFSGDVFPSLALDLAQSAVQQARLFDETGELFVWRVGNDYQARLIQDGETTPPNSFVETYWLWGTDGQPKDGFTLLSEGQQGLLHALPIPDLKKNARIGLRVQHYLEEANDGFTRIILSRLVSLETVEGGAA